MTSAFKFLFRNLAYKIVALLIAISSWFLIQGREVLEINRKLLITVQVPKGYGIKQRNTQIRDITLSGPRVLISQLDDQPIPAVVTLDESSASRRRIRITKDNISQFLDSRIKIMIHEPYLNLSFGKLTTKKVSIKEVFRGNPEKGKFVKNVIIEPQYATIKGLESKLSKIIEVLTDTIDLTGLKENKLFKVSIVNPGLKPGQFAPEKVEVNVELDKSKVNRVYTKIPVEVLSSNYQVIVSPRTVDVVLQGNMKTLNFIDKDEIKISIDLRNVLPGKYRLEVQTKIPPETVLVETKPGRVQVQVIENSGE